jgi:hypothetical protein
VGEDDSLGDTDETDEDGEEVILDVSAPEEVNSFVVFGTSREVRMDGRDAGALGWPWTAVLMRRAFVDPSGSHWFGRPAVE